jgi:hypothetical protein
MNATGKTAHASRHSEYGLQSSGVRIAPYGLARFLTSEGLERRSSGCNLKPPFGKTLPCNMCSPKAKPCIYSNI